ncbi:MAG: glycine oxidase ThiO [Gemmatimonadetes bacterium]|nr:glycine oxidase ThiO [Gemmatimonadota bacterium]
MTRSHPLPDLVVVGGGVIGLAVTREGARRGLRVSLVERGEPGMEATWASAGMLSPIGEVTSAGPFLDLALRSFDGYPPWVRSVEEESGVEVEYRECGKLQVATSDEAAARLKARRSLAEAHGLATDWLAPREVRELEPSVASSVQGGLLLHRDHRVDGRSLARALRASAARAGAEILAGREAREILWNGTRVSGVALADGSALACGSVLLAAGAWSGRLAGLPHPIPVRPVRGQMLALMSRDVTLRRVVESDNVYLVPRDDGRVLVGATVEEAGFVKACTVAGVGQLLTSALALCPALAGAEILESWSGLRPGTPDGLPILGPSPEAEGLVVATGHFRNGILLAPATARAVGELLTEGRSALLAPEFSPSRFAREAARTERR